MRVSEKVYLIAEAMDFNQSHECANVGPDRSVVFLGADQESVLVSPYRLKDLDFATFFETKVKVPTHFVREECEYKPLSAPTPLSDYWSPWIPAGKVTQGAAGIYLHLAINLAATITLAGNRFRYPPRQARLIGNSRPVLHRLRDMAALDVCHFFKVSQGSGYF